MGLRITSVAAVSAMALTGLTSCAAFLDNNQGPLQPQTVSGPCEVKKFFFLSLRSVPAEMTIRNTGEACTITLVNPALNTVINAALLTGVPENGRAAAGLTPGSRQAVVSYMPLPGYTGPDKFDVTLQPNAVGITFSVTVTR